MRLSSPWKTRISSRRAGLSWFLAFVVLAFGAGGASAQAKHPNFSGTWVMNSAKSRLEIASPDSTIFVIHHEEPMVRIFRTHAKDGTLDTVTVSLRSDSSEVEWELRGMKVMSRTWWDGDELVFWSRISQGDRRGSQVVRYSLSADGKTFTAIERVDAPQPHLNRWVFDRRN